MSKQKELAKNTLILTVGKVCTQFINFFLLPLYTKLLTPDAYGVVELFNTYIALLVPLFNLQFENGMFRFMLDCRDDKKRQSEIFSTVAVSNFVQAAVYILFFVIAQRFIHSPYKIFLAVDVTLNIFLNTMLQFPRGIGRNSVYAFASFISASGCVALNVVFIAGMKMGATGMFMAGVVSKIITLVYLAASQKVWRYFKISLASKKLFKEICAYSVPLIPNQLSWWVMGASDKSVVSHFISLAANGIYSIANKFSSIYITFYNIFNMSWTESVSLHLKDEDRDEFLGETINSMFKLFSSVCLGMIACMPFVFPYIINKQYAEAYDQIPILMTAVLFQVVVGLYSVIYVALKKSVEIAKTSAMSAAINLIVDLVLVKFIGIYAASISTLAAYAVMAVYRYFHVKKYVNIPLKKSVVITTLLGGGICLASYYYNHLLTNVLVLAAVGVYAFVINKDFLCSAVKIVKNKLVRRA